MLACDFGFSSDVFTLPSLQPKVPIPQGKSHVTRSSARMANREAAAFQAHLLKEACSAPSQLGYLLFGVRARRDVGVNWSAVSVRTGACSVICLVPGPEEGLYKQSLSERIQSF